MSDTIDHKKIAWCQIYPGLGIARLGNSPDDFFIGPETPGQPASPIGGFKDAAGRIKRQAARFRIYAYDAQGAVLGELTAADANIVWSVHLTNRKAEYMTFRGRFWQSQYPNFYKYNPDETPLRNQEIMDPAERAKVLVIDPGPRSIKAGDEPVEFDGGTIGPLPYSDIPVPATGSDPLSGTRNGWWNCAEKSQLLEPVRMSGKAEVPLGTLRVDAEGRLLVLGGYGNTDTLIPNNDIGRLMTNDYYANNDYWHDDTSDGPVTATVTVDGHDVPVKDKAWVLVVPPKFVPFAECLTTLYDTAMETWEKSHSGSLPERPVSFTTHIYPILRRLAGYTWLNATATQHHGPNTNNYFADVHSPLFALLSSNTGEDAARERRRIFERLRPPGLVAETPDAADTEESSKFAKYIFMPQMSGDGGEPTTVDDTPGSPLDQVFDCKTGQSWPETQPTTQPGGNYITWLTLSERQYGDMKLWAEGKFATDWKGVPQPVPLEKLPLADQPDALSRAALEPCVGAPFFPGIEITYIAIRPDTWSGPCRVKQSFRPGDITSHMALPWQSDFSECATNWWPTARPDDVVSQESFEDLLRQHPPGDEGALGRLLATRVPWARGIPTSSPGRDNAMVKAWSHFGFVVPREAGPGQIAYVETERSPYFGFSERDFFYYLMNIDSYPDFVPRARQLVHEYLAQGRQNMEEADSDEVWSFFDYSPAALANRLELIYANFVRDNQATADRRLLSSTTFVPQNYLATSTRERQIYGLLQMAPFNQLDGAWLRRAVPDGTVDPVGELLAQIRQDELGDGEVAQNHANVYTDVLKSVNIYLPDLHTRAYAQDQRFLDEAFTQPCFLLAISQFDDDFLPELLGMTLYLEWSSIGLIATVNTLEAFGIDPIYHKLHVGIDNAASGHGARARDAVEMYLDQIRASQGDDAMQAAWKRIWTGYVTFGTLGSLFTAIDSHYQSNSYASRVANLIAAKAPFASQTHGTKRLGGAAINDWFQDPPGLMNELQAAGLIVPGRADLSPFFQLLSFNGPMFHVFTADEEQLLRDWCNSLVQPNRPGMSLHNAMNHVINALRQRQAGEAGHMVRISGPDPKGGGGIVTLSLQEWFALPNDNNAGNTALMGALAHRENGWIVPFDSIASPLTSSLLAGNGDMAEAFRSVLPDGSGRTFGNVLAQWIDAGCPLGAPALMAAQVPVMRGKPLVHTIYRRRDGKILGMGTPH
jgi:hypothetical protein